MEERALFLSLNTLALVYSTLFLQNTFAKSTAELTLGRCNVFGPSECRAYYRIKGQPESDVGLTTEYAEQRCSHSIRFVNEQDLPEPKNRIRIQADCLNKTADIIWTQRIRKAKGKKLSGFLLEVEYAASEDPTLTLRYLCYRILLDEAILLSVFKNKLTLLEFGLPCFKSATYAYMGTSVVSISSQNKASSGSSSQKCSYRVHRQTEKYEASPRMQCPSVCNSWRPHLRLQIVQNEHGECRSLRLHLYNIVKDLSYVRFFIVHNESGEVVLDQSLDHEINSSVREIVKETSFLKENGRYCAKMEVCCKDQISSTCDRTMKFISDFVSCMVTSSPATTILAHPRHEIRRWIPVIVGIASIGLISLVICFLFRGHFAVCKECNRSCFQIYRPSAQPVDEIPNGNNQQPAQEQRKIPTANYQP